MTVRTIGDDIMYHNLHHQMLVRGIFSVINAPKSVKILLAPRTKTTPLNKKGGLTLRLEPPKLY
ncbi:hypothetical protein DFQ12_3580 [Sphingobacterium detergens]|uniref:Uncharacterized protein n=1 Tax=Sphingobacterium detergens TaxID=1145106 RepID=A0A420AYD9_SPHD1|nr:hypothetical protein DFQ12_3580 [Sphingobacterium detergens]